MLQRTALLISSDDCGWADLRTTLRSLGTVHVVGDTTSGGQACQLAIALNPDVIITAATIEGTSVLTLLTDLHHNLSPMNKILVVAHQFSLTELVALIHLGITGYLLWSDLSRETLRHCLAAMIAGDIMIASQTVAKAFIDAQSGTLDQCDASVQLTARERAVLHYLARGMTRKQIAQMLHQGEATVKRAVASLEVKLDAPNPFVLALQAARRGLLP